MSAEKATDVFLQRKKVWLLLGTFFFFYLEEFDLFFAQTLLSTVAPMRVFTLNGERKKRGIVCLKQYFICKRQ